MKGSNPYLPAERDKLILLSICPFLLVLATAFLPWSGMPKAYTKFKERISNIIKNNYFAIVISAAAMQMLGSGR